MISRLVRLFRIPKFLAMLNIEKFTKFLSSFLGGGSSREHRVKTHFIFTLVIYKIFSVTMRAVIVTYFLGCLWYLSSKYINPDNTEGTFFKDERFTDIIHLLSSYLIEDIQLKLFYLSHKIWLNSHVVF